MKIVIFQGEAICSAEVLAGFGRGSGRVQQGFRPGSAGFSQGSAGFWQGSADDLVLGSL